MFLILILIRTRKTLIPVQMRVQRRMLARRRTRNLQLKHHLRLQVLWAVQQVRETEVYGEMRQMKGWQVHKFGCWGDLEIFLLLSHVPVYYPSRCLYHHCSIAVIYISFRALFFFFPLVFFICKRCVVAILSVHDRLFHIVSSGNKSLSWCEPTLLIGDTHTLGFCSFIASHEYDIIYHVDGYALV
jgi:hypothetical protein